MKWLPRPRFIHVSPWLLAAATALLVLIVVTFALSNIQREKRLMTRAMLQKAATMNRVIRSASRAACVADLKRGNWDPDPWYEYVQRVIDHLSDDPDLHFLTVIDQEGEVYAHSRRVMRGKQLKILLPETLPDRKSGTPFVYRVNEEKGQPRFFEVLGLFTPFQPVRPPFPLVLHELHRQLSRKGMGEFDAPLRLGANPDPSRRYFLVVALDMKDFDRALGQLRFQVLVLSLTMLLVGIGGWLSLAAVQGYRVSRKALHEIQAFTGLLISKLPVGIIATDKSGRIATWNQAVAELTGLEAAQATGRKPTEVLPPVLASCFTGSRGKREEEINGASREVTLELHGETYTLSCHHLIISSQADGAEGEVLLLTNMTELKNLEKEMRENERLAAVGRMAAGVAHEVRNPLSSIKGLALLLKGKFVPESNEEKTASLLIQEVERMNRTISELLSFTRPASLELSRVDLGELLEEQVRLLAADTSSDNITFYLHPESDLRPAAADRDRLSQVFLNIILNSIQAMPDGGELTIHAWNNPEHSTVIITITDTGRGMDRETLGQVFFPYFTTKSNGTGIGLALSQKVINDHGGTIYLSSTEGEGTTVTIELPQYFGPEQQVD